MTLYTQASSNKAKTWFYLMLYLAILLGLFYVLGYIFESYAIFLIGAVFVIIQGVVSYWFSDKVALSVSGAKEIDPNQHRELYRLVENLSITAGLPMPKVHIIPDSAMNAFATGRDPQHASIAVTEGLLQRLDKNELEGVLAHELAHVGNYDIRLMSMVMVMAGFIALISDFALRGLFFGAGDDNRNTSPVMLIVGLALIILAPVAATLIQLAISRKREFLADGTAVLMTRYPEGMISALRKIGGDKEPLEVANKATAHLYFSNPLKGGFVANLFSTHPPIEKRIEALQKGSGLLENQ